MDNHLWLCPIEDRHNVDSAREGMLEGLALGSYLLLVDFTGRLFREGKAVISAELTGIFDRLGTSAETWQARLEEDSKSGRLLGRFFAASRTRLCAKSPHTSLEGPPPRKPRRLPAMTKICFAVSFAPASL